MKSKPLLPVLSLFLLAMWLLLNDSLTLGQLLLGMLFAAFITHAVTRLRPLSARPRRLYNAIRLLFHVVLDVIRSNGAVAWLILRPSRRPPRSAFMQIPLELRDPHGLAMLSMIVTATPGTVWSGHDLENNILTLHVLDLQDEGAWLRIIKERYERPLLEIFQ